MKRLQNPKKRTAAKKFKAARKEWRVVKGVAPGRDEEYKAWIRDQKCFICAMLDMPQKSRTEAAHVGAVRGLGQKAPDDSCVPACSDHHTRSPLSLHRLQLRVWDWLGISREVIIARYQRAYAKFKKESAVASNSD